MLRRRRGGSRLSAKMEATSRKALVAIGLGNHFLLWVRGVCSLASCSARVPGSRNAPAVSQLPAHTIRSNALSMLPKPFLGALGRLPGRLLGEGPEKR